MEESWQAQKERGSATLLRMVVWFSLRLGYPTGRILLYPISLYFLLFSGPARRASRDYLGRVLGRRPGTVDLFRHYHTFAATILDRFYLLSGRGEEYDIRFHGLELIEKYGAQNSGCLLLGAHIGSFDALRSLAERAGVTVKALMFPDNSSRMGAVLAALNPGLAENIIPLGTPRSIMQAHECLSRGEFVGLLADRNTRGDKRIAVPFLGDDAEFPLGPMMLAALAERPVVLFFCLYGGSRRYDIHFELLTERAPKGCRKNPEVMRGLIADYARRLESYCRSAPYNWFNFYDFWRKDEA